jgi:hypothetical protein
MLRDGAGKAVADAVIRLHLTSGGSNYTSKTAPNGRFAFADVPAGGYEVSVKVADREWKTASPVVIKDAAILSMALQLAAEGKEVRLVDAVQFESGDGAADQSRIWHHQQDCGDVAADSIIPEGDLLSATCALQAALGRCRLAGTAEDCVSSPSSVIRAP